jgi:molecular chaperone DnaK
MTWISYISDKCCVTENYAVGIDLGTTNCCVAVYHEGQIKIITNTIGMKTTPSTVYFEETGHTFGEAAISRGFADTNNCISGESSNFRELSFTVLSHRPVNVEVSLSIYQPLTSPTSRYSQFYFFISYQYDAFFLAY